MNQQLDPRLIQPAMKKACSVLDILLRAGFSAYFVGGSVRDTLLGKRIHDIDIATSARPEQTLQLFPHSIPTGLQHGTVTVVHDGQSYEVTTFRAEYGYSDYRHPAKISFVSELAEDLQRRDFTINAMAIDCHWQLYDPFGGQVHLHEGIIATVGSSSERFQEDALRMLRAIRFAATYQFQIAESCMRAIWKHGELLQHIAMERLAYELGRMMQAKEPAAAVTLLQESKLLRHAKEGLHLAQGSCRQLPQLAKRSDSTNWTLLFLYSSLTYEQAAEDMKALRLSNQLQEEIGTLLQLCDWFHANSHADERLKVQWLHKLLLYPLDHLEQWLEQFAPFGANMTMLQRYNTALPIKSIKQLKVSGKHLLQWRNEPAGPWVKALLNNIFIAVASGRLQNDKQKIEEFVKERANS